MASWFGKITPRPTPLSFADADRISTRTSGRAFPGPISSSYQPPRSTQYTDRAGGQYYWNKGRDWINAGGADQLFIGMMDEYDEATAVMPMTDDPPNPSATYGRFLTNLGKPGDWWMSLTDEIKRMMFQQRANTSTLPDLASVANRSNIGAEASCDLGTTDIVNSLSRVPNSGDGNTLVETVGGKECRGNTTPATDRYLYFNVANTFAHQLTNGDVTVEVEYHDANTSTVLGLQYDSASAVYRDHPQSITTTGSNTWRTVRFEMMDAYFGGRQNGFADFRLYFSGKKLNVNRVWVRLPEGKAFPFTWTNAAAGSPLNWSQNANWLGGIIGQSDLTSTVCFFTGQPMPGGSVSISNNLTGQQFGTLQLGGIASPLAATTVTLSGNAADAFNNLLEYALATNPTQPNTAPYSLTKQGNTLTFTYIRRSLVPDLTYAVEWSQTLAASSWSTVGVTQQITSDDGITRIVRATVPAGSGRQYLRLKINSL
jgi:hypothetical protein